MDPTETINQPKPVVKPQKSTLLRVLTVVVILLLILVVAALFFAYPDYREMKKLENKYRANSSCKQPIFSMSFRDSNTDDECKRLEDEYTSYRHACFGALHGEDLLEKIRCMLITSFHDLNLPAL